MERALKPDARRLRSQIVRQEEIIERASMAVAEARDDLARMHEALEKRFNRVIPQDALLIDVLQLVDIQPDSRWIWTGIRNNAGLATIRVHNSEQSLVRYLAIMFGILSEGENGMLFPKGVGRGKLGDVDDVNPWHRELRASDGPIGNPHRYTFTT